MAKYDAGEDLDQKVLSILKERSGQSGQLVLATHDDLLRYSTDFSAALMAVECLRGRWGFIIKTIDPLMKKDTRRWAAQLFDGDIGISNGVGNVVGWREYHGWGSTLPLAICRAIVAMDEGEIVRTSGECDAEDKTVEETV